MNPAAYLERVGLRGPAGAPDLHCLEALLRAHLLTVPFENLDIVRGVTTSLELETFYRKVVVERRGGICCELNGLFEWLLGRLGYTTAILSARVFREGGVLSPEFDHMALLVMAGEPHLVDVGFGGTQSSRTLPLTGKVREGVTGAHRVRQVGEELHDLERREGRRWVGVYRFSLRSRRLDEFRARYAYHRSSPDAPFAATDLCSRLTSNGRVTLSGASLTITDHGTKRRIPICSETERRRHLEEQFGIFLTAGGGRHGCAGACAGADPAGRS